MPFSVEKHTLVMEKTESLEAFYKRKYNWMPDNLRNDIGHFNVFNLEPLPKGKTRQLPYRRRDYFKILLVLGEVHFKSFIETDQLECF